MVDAFWRFGTVRVCESGRLGVYVPEKCDVMKVFFDYDKDATDNLNGRVTDPASAPFSKVGTPR